MKWVLLIWNNIGLEFVSTLILGQEDQTEVIYSDPLDALEKATDTRIYDCPEYGEDKVDEEEVIYEEAGKKLQQINVQVQSSPKRRKRATVSALGNLILIKKFFQSPIYPL